MKKKEFPKHLNIGIIAKNLPIVSKTSNSGFLWPIAKGLKEKGHNVTVFSTSSFSTTGSTANSSPHTIEQDGVTAHFFKTNNQTIFESLIQKTFIKQNNKTPFHIIHSIDNSGKAIGKIKKKLRFAMAYDVEATQMSQLFSIMALSQETLTGLLRTSLSITYKFLNTYLRGDRKLLKGADGMFVTSPLQRITLERYYLYPDAKTFTVPYGSEARDLSPKGNLSELRHKLNIPESTKVIVTISDMCELGEIKNLLLAFQKITIKKPNTKLIIIGHGPFRKKIEFEMFQLALGNKVLLTGPIKNEEVVDYIALSNIYINLSSRTSGFEPSMLEAMAQEKIIIGSEISPIATIVEDGIDGFLLRPADTSNLVKLILDIFSDKFSILEVGKAAKKKVLDLFDTEKMVNQTLNAYYKILKNTGYYNK